MENVSISEVLGLQDEWVDNLQRSVKTALDDEDGIAEAMLKMINMVQLETHGVEIEPSQFERKVAYASFAIGALVSKNMLRRDLLSKILLTLSKHDVCEEASVDVMKIIID